jgi:hypothetical protein
MTRRALGSIDGIQLGQFEVGRVYDVASVLACYLVTAGYARPCDGEPPDAAPPLHEQGIDRLGNARGTRKPFTFGERNVTVADAADRPPRRKPARRAREANRSQEPA